MKRYIEQLIDDIRQASWNVNPPHELWAKSKADPDDELELEDMSFAEQYIYGEQQPIGQITGIGPGQLPAPEKLSVDEQAQLAVELEKLLDLFHFKLDFPESFPASLRYPFIRNFWSESHVPLSFGENHIEFCDMEEENCPFPGYCTTCKEAAEQMRIDEEQEKGAKCVFDFDFDVEDLLPSLEQIRECARENRELREKEDELDENGDEEDDECVVPDFQDGFFDDDGSPIDPESVPVPGLCVICKMYQVDDPEENLLCLMNRFDQRNDDDFQCGMFEKI
ncbi:hypothetical protein [Mangrovibacterium marinum]|uniref:Uncharacterized protein n=1 Tax=Mangrovibacterium marinum TaxID=1639118 RepID=A0A2T5C486_9BACT|nr:hypothetical protein [Mangrovibacterium marinum]PTN09613.1 hypothetical protein C8N47_104159 [Mangrovibacterium marinum]